MLRRRRKGGGGCFEVKANRSYRVWMIILCFFILLNKFQ